MKCPLGLGVSISMYMYPNVLLVCLVNAMGMAAWPGRARREEREKRGKGHLAVWHSQARQTRRRKARPVQGGFWPWSFGLSLCLWSQVLPDPAQQNYRVCLCLCDDAADTLLSSPPWATVTRPSLSFPARKCVTPSSVLVQLWPPWI